MENERKELLKMCEGKNMKKTAEKINKYIDKFIDVKINPIPKNVKITVYCDGGDLDSCGFMENVTYDDIGINLFIVKKWILQSDLDLLLNKYDLILSDPAWKQSKGGKKNVRPKSSGEELTYTTITLEEIEELQRQMRDKSNDNHILFLWTIDKYLHESEAMILRLGYKLHARMIWNKVTGIPAAFTVRYGHEYLLYCYYGKLLPVAKEERGKIHTVFTEQVKAHSQKPEISYQIIERLYPRARKVEMFCRRKRNGWDAWGNEVETDINLNGFEEAKERGQKNKK